MPRTGLRRCPLALWLALSLDGVALAFLLAGLFGDLRRRGRDYGDMLVYTGAIGVLASLLGWVLWYVGNIELGPAELGPAELGLDYRPSPPPLERLVRKISRRISLRLARPPPRHETTAELD